MKTNKKQTKSVPEYAKNNVGNYYYDFPNECGPGRELLCLSNISTIIFRLTNLSFVITCLMRRP
jgi:hypothetical protein